MSDDAPGTSAGSEAIRALAELRESPSPGFSGRVRNSIERRRLATELGDLSWRGLGLLLSEYFDLSIRLLRAEEPTEGGDP